MNKEKIVKFILNKNIIKFGKFITKSKRETPYFINTGCFSQSSDLIQLASYYAETIWQKFKNNFNVLYGPAYKGIPIAIATALILNQKYQHNVKISFNRKEEKSYGEKGQFVYYEPNKDDEVIILEDIITAGTAIRESINLLKNTHIKSIITFIDRKEKGRGEQAVSQEIEEEFKIKLFSIITIDDILFYMRENACIEENIMDKIKKYRAIYGVS